MVTWGDADYGGDSSEVQDELKDQIVKKIYSNPHAFAAVLGNGRVVTWGSAEEGGDNSEVQEELKGQVVEIYSSRETFAAVLRGGRVVSWGVFQGLINIPNNRKVMDIIGNTIILDNWDALNFDDESYSLLNDVNHRAFIINRRRQRRRQRRIYTSAMERTLLNAGDSEKLLEGPARSHQLEALGMLDLREFLLPFLGVWRGGPEGEGEGEGEGE